MKKNLTLLTLLFSIVFCSNVFAQVKKKIRPTTVPVHVSAITSAHSLKLSQSKAKAKTVKKTNSVLAPGDCQLILPPYPLDSSILLETSYQYEYIVGLNDYGDLQKAQFYNFSTYSANSYLNSVDIFFGDAYSDSTADYNELVPIRIFDGTSGTPGAQIGEVDLTLGEIYDTVYNGGGLTTVDFTNVPLPASKKIFISVDMSNLIQDYDSGADTYSGDYLGIYSSDFDSTTTNTAWEQWDDATWHPFTDPNGWGGKLSIAMVPFIGQSNGTCTQIVPVRLRSFTAQTFGSANKLVWQTTNELNNKGFDVQRSTDGVNFVTIGYVAAQATSSIYSFVDNAPLDQLTYYRFTQIDINGNVSYSKTVTLTRTKVASGIVSGYPNPVTNVFNVVLNVPTTNASALLISDATGKTLMVKTLRSIGTNQTVTLNVASLAKGTYFVRLAGDGENKILKFVKQ